MAFADCVSLNLTKQLKGEETYSSELLKEIEFKEERLTMMITPTVTTANQVLIPTNRHRAKDTPVTFAGQKDSYHFSTGQVDTVHIPAEQKSKLVVQLNELAKKIQAGEYSVKPASGKYKGLGKGFKIGDADFGPNWLMNGEFIIRPRQGSETDIQQVTLKRTRTTRSRKVLSIEIQQKTGPTLKFQQQGGMHRHDSLIPFIEAVCAQVNKIRRNEHSFEGDMLDNLKF